MPCSSTPAPRPRPCTLCIPDRCNDVRRRMPLSRSFVWRDRPIYAHANALAEGAAARVHDTTVGTKGAPPYAVYCCNRSRRRQCSVELSARPQKLEPNALRCTDSVEVWLLHLPKKCVATSCDRSSSNGPAGPGRQAVEFGQDCLT
jgi:hypothetical protein